MHRAVMVLRRLVVAVFLCLTLCRDGHAQGIQCPDKVEVTEDVGSALLCVSADLRGVPVDIDDRGTWNVTSTDGTAIAGVDYERIDSNILSSGFICIGVPIIDDAEYEGQEEFSVVFTLVVSSDSCTSQVEITDFEDLQDCRPPAMMGFAEGDGTVEVCVTLIGNDIGGVVVEDSTATGGGVDYSASTGQSITIDSDGIESCIIVNITNDSEVEDIENFTVRFRQGFRDGRMTCAETVQVQILDNDDAVPPIECEQLHYAVQENRSVEVCGLINDTTGELPPTGKIIATLMNEDGAELAGEMYELEIQSPQRHCAQLSIEDDLVPEPPTFYTIRLEWGGPTPNIAPQPGTCDLVVVDNDDIYSICFPNPPFPLISFLFIDYNKFPFCLATLDVEPVISEECEQTERSCSHLSDTNIDTLPVDQQLMIAGRSFGSDLEMACVEEIHSFVQDLYLVNISSPPEETCTADCALYTGGVDGCSEGVLVLLNVNGPSALDTDREPFVLENCPTDLMFHFSCCQSEVPNSCYDGSEAPTNRTESPTNETEPTPSASDDKEGESGLYIGAAVAGGVLCVLIIVTAITIAAICMKRKRQPRELQHEMTNTEYADIDKTTLKKKAIDTKVNVAYATSGNLIRINDNTAYGVTSSHNEPYYEYPEMQELVYDYPAL